MEESCEWPCKDKNGRIWVSEQILNSNGTNGAAQMPDGGQKLEMKMTRK